jgi:V8-like Glu-specific endopeptidase
MPSCFRLSKTWTVVMFVVGFGAGCVGQGPADDGVESVGRGIQNGTLVGPGGMGFAAKIDQTMSDGKKLICTGAFITPHVVLTAAHCTRNYDYGTTITPTTDTVIRYGENFASSQKIAGGEKVGWRELGSTDIGLYRVAQAVTLPVIPKVYRNCATVNLVGGRVVVYGRMINAKQAPTAELYMSAERIVRAIASNVGANGNYLQIDATTDSGDSGGPWVYSQDRIVAVTHTSAYGARFCDVAAEIETQVKDWGDTLSFVEDSAMDGGSPDQGGAAGRGDAASKVDGAGGANDAGSAGGRADAGGGAGGAAGRTGAGGGAGGSVGRGGASASGVTTSGGAGGAGGAVSQTGTGGSSVDTGGKGAGGNAGGVSGSGVPSSAGAAGSAAGGSSPRSGSSQGGTSTDSQASAAAGRRTDSGTTSGKAASGCSCRTLGDDRHGRPSATLVLFLVLASVIALVGRDNRRQG